MRVKQGHLWVFDSNSNTCEISLYLSLSFKILKHIRKDISRYWVQHIKY